MDSNSDLETIKSLISQNQLEQAAERLDRVLAGDPQNDKAWILAAEIIDEPTKKIEYLKLSLEHNPLQEEAVHLLAKVEADEFFKKTYAKDKWSDHLNLAGYMKIIVAFGLAIGWIYMLS